jgi:hypothetical protein
MLTLLLSRGCGVRNMAFIFRIPPEVSVPCCDL